MPPRFRPHGLIRRASDGHRQRSGVSFPLRDRSTPIYLCPHCSTQPSLDRGRLGRSVQGTEVRGALRPLPYRSSDPVLPRRSARSFRASGFPLDLSGHLCGSGAPGLRADPGHPGRRRSGSARAVPTAKSLCCNERLSEGAPILGEMPSQVGQSALVLRPLTALSYCTCVL